MISSLEITIATNHNYYLSQLPEFILNAHALGIHGINLYGSQLSDIYQIADHTYFLNIAHKHTVLNDIIEDVIGIYINKYNGILSGINLMPDMYSITKNDWGKYQLQLENIVKICSANKMVTRMIVDINKTQFDYQYERLTDICEQIGINNMIMGSFNSKILSHIDCGLILRSLKQRVNIPIGYIGNLNKEESTHINKMELFPIVVPVKSFLSIID